MNRWVAVRDPKATWRADLTAAAHDDQALLQWAMASLEAGEETGAFVVERAPRLGWRRGDSPLSAAIGDLYERARRIDLFWFASSVLPVDGARFGSATVLAYYEWDGSIVEEPVSDVGGLLARLRPNDVDDSDVLMATVAPVTIRGTLVDRGDPGRSEWFAVPDHPFVTFSLHSDIWFPWVRGLLEEDDGPRWHDNRELAARHTPRLNQFLDAVRDATERLGGSLRLDEPPGPFGATDRGIDLSFAPS